jgi:transcriptional regulator with XRE-family HTH domain
MDQSTPNHRNGTFLAPIITFSFLVGVGTGGDYTPSYHALRSERGVISNARSEPKPKSNGFAISADIEQIKSVLNITMTELARSLGVSRQAPYNWVAGGAIKEDNLSKLNELRSAANVFVAENIEVQPRLLHRKLSGGKSLLETIAIGGNGEQAARALVDLLRIEENQREALAKLFAERNQPQNAGLGLPPLNDA